MGVRNLNHDERVADGLLGEHVAKEDRLVGRRVERLVNREKKGRRRRRKEKGFH